MQRKKSTKDLVSAAKSASAIRAGFNLAEEAICCSLQLSSTGSVEGLCRQEGSSNVDGAVCSRLVIFLGRHDALFVLCTD